MLLWKVKQESGKKRVVSKEERQEQEPRPPAQETPAAQCLLSCAPAVGGSRTDPGPLSPPPAHRLGARCGRCRRAPDFLSQLFPGFMS